MAGFEFDTIFTKPTIIIYRLCGAYPSGSMSMIYSMILLIVFIGHLMCLPTIIVEIDESYNNVTHVRYSLLELFSLHRLAIATFPTLLICTNLASRLTNLILLHNYLPAIITGVRNVDRIVKLSDLHTKWYKVHSWINIFIIAVLTIIMELSVLRDLSKNDDIGSFVFIWYLLLFLGNISSCCTEMQYISICYALKLRFSHIVTELNSLSTVSESFMMKQIYRYIVNDKTSVKSISNDWIHGQNEEKITEGMSIENKLMCYRNLKDTLRTMTVSSCEFSTVHPKFFDKIKVLHMVYRNLSRVIWNVESLYQLQLLVSISSLFLIILFHIYYLVIFGSTHGQINRILGANVFWIMHFLIRFCILICSAYSMSCEAKKAKPLVAAINNRFLDHECKEELLLFYNYMTSCKLEFTAYGFFTLNTRLITSAIGAGTTYLVILVQFHSN